MTSCAATTDGAAEPACRKVSPGLVRYGGRQGFTYDEGLSRESVGSRGLCMHHLTIPPGGRARAHRHDGHETAILVLSGRAVMAWGDRLQHRLEVVAGEMLYIPAGMPHLPWNPGPEPCTAVIARTDPHEQESVVLLPDLDALVP
ncbi:cupin domain-containing protein [Rubellimicrobium sp. CFH 75288]|uniref:cupin domain-containing protein n=1 Tax=Rubellimicrobium sp. CFH 75288 TaxID=2697034 RepID=UPI00141247B6|nr:cupin domain-containing protein [Rubellimicrobium sp. CFH 75288]NAZ37689.1 cupin domain-containing protein [Rubellimicrobium sp. CFH 75288]